MLGRLLRKASQMSRLYSQQFRARSSARWGVSYSIGAMIGAALLNTGLVFCSTNAEDADTQVAETTMLESVPASLLFDNPHIVSTIFGHISADYDDLGQIEPDEVEVTVQPHVFSQIGIIDKDGVRKMCAEWTDNIEEEQNAKSTVAASDVFCDIGSGVGNVCLQVLGEVPSCRKSIGIEIIPSRHRMAVEAFENAQRCLPSLFGQAVGKDAAFYQIDLVEAAPTLAKEGVTVIFSHSWMFDDDLMAKFAAMVRECGPQLRFVISSRPFDGAGAILGDEWVLEKKTSFSADWNPHSPFFIYKRNT